jgi:hypothetical protein
MSFEDFWAETFKGGIAAAELPAARALAERAWDAAVCASSARCFERGKFREPAVIHAEITQLHTWASPEGQIP